MLGLAAFALERWHEARSELLAFRRLAGRRTHDHLIADCYTTEGNPGRALEILDDLAPADLPARAWSDVALARARALAANGKPDLALGVLRTTRAADPAARARLDEAIAALQR